MCGILLKQHKPTEAGEGEWNEVRTVKSQRRHCKALVALVKTLDSI